MKLIHIKTLTDIAKGDMLVVTGNHPKGPKTQMHVVEFVKVSQNDGTEIILKKRGNLYFNLGMYLAGKSWWVTNVRKLVVEEDNSPKMTVNFDGLRRRAFHSYNRVVEELNEQIIENYVRFRPVEIQEHMDELKDCLVTLKWMYDQDGQFTTIDDVELKDFNPELDDEY